MSQRFSFEIKSPAGRPFPHKVLMVQGPTEDAGDVLLKLVSFLLFFRERLQVAPHLHDDNIPFVPDLVQLDYLLRPALWVECGECDLRRLDRLAVKAPEAELWVVRRSVEEAEVLLRGMAKGGLRRRRYSVLAFEAAFFAEMLGQLQLRNEVFWVGGQPEAPALQLEFNGLWFEGELRLTRF